MSTLENNCTDSYVPKLNRHTFIPYVEPIGNQEHAQPVFNHGDHEAFSESWDGYILLPEKKEYTIRVAADDLASFSLDAFPDKVAKLEPRGPKGGGRYQYSDSVNLGELLPGYYRVHIDFTNINYTDGKNAARLAVEVNNQQITLGALHTVNLITAAQAETLLEKYNPVNYLNMEPYSVWEYVGGGLFQEHTDEMKKYTDENGFYDETAHRNDDQASWYNTCALRASIALSDFGINLKGWQNLGVQGDKHLGTDGAAIVAASVMTSFFEKTFGNADFIAAKDYKYLNPGNDSICFGGRHSQENGGHRHVGFDLGIYGIAGGGITEKVWILYRPTWGAPTKSKL